MADFSIQISAFSKKKFKLFQYFFSSNFDFVSLPWGHMRSHKKCGPDRFSRFDVYFLQTDRQSTYIYRYIFQTYSRHPGEPGSIPFSLKPDLSPHAPHHPHPLQDKEHPEDYSTDPLITSEDHLKEYDLDYVDEEEIDQFNEIEDEEEYNDEGLGKDQEIEAAEPNRIAKLQIIVIIKGTVHLFGFFHG